jgi:integrase
MAQWVRRARVGGGESIQIKWRQDGRWQCETFSDPRMAAQFRTAVEVAGNVWPLDWVKGEGWKQSRVEPGLEPVGVTVEDVATGPDGYFVGQERRKRRGKIKPYTLHRDRRTYELHLRGTFGQVGYVDLDEDQISDWIDGQFDHGASAKSIRNRHGLLSSIVKHGQERMKLRPDNPCALSELPELDTATSQARQIRFFQHGEWALFRSCVKSDAHLLLDLELSTGIRWGEISALRVEDVTFTGEDEARQANLHIVRAWSHRSPDDTSPIRWNETENRSWVLGPPKNGRARWVVVTGDVAARLEEAIAGRAEGHYVFETRHGNPWRIARSREMVAVFEGLSRSGNEAAQLNRAIQQYGLALRYWYFGGEWLALAHLYMAAETLADVVIAYACKTDGIDTETLASRQGIDISDSKNLGHHLQVWARKEIIFEGDNDTYRDARYASDGIEHGFLEMEQVNRHAQSVTAITFRYIRKTILRLLGISRAESAELYERSPRDVGSFRKMIRGHFIGGGSDPAPANEEYPRLDWSSGIKTVQREDEKFVISFQEKFTVRCAPSYGFRGLAIEARGRVEPGANPIQLSEVAEVIEEATTGTSATDEVFALMKRASRLASGVAAPSTVAGIPTLMLNVFSLFAEQISLFEAIEVLLRDNRPVEAMVLLRSLILGACRLESIANHANHEGAAIRIKLDALERQAKLYESEPLIANGTRDQIARYRSKAAEKGIVVLDAPPDIRETAFYAKSTNSLSFVEEVALPSDFAAMFHTVKDDEGNPSLHTRVSDSQLLSGVGVDAVDALTASVVALAQALDWPLDEPLTAEINAQVTRMSEEAVAS